MEIIVNIYYFVEQYKSIFTRTLQLTVLTVFYTEYACYLPEHNKNPANIFNFFKNRNHKRINIRR